MTLPKVEIFSLFWQKYCMVKFRGAPGDEKDYRTRERAKKIKLILNSKKSEFVVVCGRRRVGKTFIIREFFKENIVKDC